MIVFRLLQSPQLWNEPSSQLKKSADLAEDILRESNLDDADRITVAYSLADYRYTTNRLAKTAFRTSLGFAASLTAPWLVLAGLCSFTAGVDMPPHAQWRDVDKMKLLNRLRWGKTNGFQADSGWKPQIWAYCAADLAGTPGGKKTATKCKDQYQGIKKNFTEVHVIRNLSGFGWDDGLKLVTATQDAWDCLFAAHPDYTRWQTTLFPLYDDMLFLVDGIIATKVGAFHTGAPAFNASAHMQPTASANISAISSQNTAVSQSSISTSQSSQLTSTLQPSQATSMPVTPQTPAHQNTTFSSSLSTNDLLASSPPPMAQKRAASSSPEKPNGRRHRKPRNAEVGTDIAAALRDVAGSLKVVGSPEACMRAVQQMEDDDKFSDDESATIMRLFTMDSAVAQTYTASKKKSTRTALVRDSVEAAQRKGLL
ncbi:hypothetical protein B0H13DRAFT_2668455 [Mycena leptocephala]|nr:hypothetical protein B0H13DRAFT_2668455 [Mycena leptocephala]